MKFHHSSSIIKCYLGRVGAVRREEHDRRDESHVFIKEILNQSGNAPVVPMTVNEEHFSQELKPRESEVRASHGLATFFSHDTKSYMGFLNHGHIIGSITNRSCNRSMREFFD